MTERLLTWSLSKEVSLRLTTLVAVPKRLPFNAARLAQHFSAFATAFRLNFAEVVLDITTRYDRFHTGIVSTRSLPGSQSNLGCWLGLRT